MHCKDDHTTTSFLSSLAAYRDLGTASPTLSKPPLYKPSLPSASSIPTTWQHILSAFSLLQTTMTLNGLLEWSTAHIYLEVQQEIQCA